MRPQTEWISPFYAHYIIPKRYLKCSLLIFGHNYSMNQKSRFVLYAVFPQTIERLNEVLEQSPSDVQLIIENCAGMGNQIGASFKEIGKILKALGNARVQVCLDTQHSFAAGYDVATKDGLEKTIEEFDKEIGLEHLVAVHANDSKIAFAGGVDRHENIGDGLIGLKGFEIIMSHVAFREVPFFLEVPGVERNGPDEENINRLKSIRGDLGI